MDVAAPDEGDHQYAISDAISVTPLDEAAPDDEKEMCGEAAAGVTAAGVAASTRPCNIVQVTVEQYRDQAQHGGHGEGAEAISGNQRQSEAIRGNQWHSEAMEWVQRSPRHCRLPAAPS